MPVPVSRPERQPEYQIAALWIGGPLSFLEQLCLLSFVHAGHHVRLYTYDGVPNVPSGIEVADANDIMPIQKDVVHQASGSPAPQSDSFRYQMLAKLDRTIWADTDAYCLRPFVPKDGHFHAWGDRRTIYSGVLALPQDSATLERLIALTADPFAIPPFLTGEKRAELEAAAAAGSPKHAGEMPWGIWGPTALTHYLTETGEDRHSMAPVTLYPVAYKDRRMLLRPNWDASGHITGESLSIHFYGRRMRRRIVSHEPGGIPRPRSLLGKLLKSHGVDPHLAPIPRRPGDPGYEAEAAE